MNKNLIFCFMVLTSSLFSQNNVNFSHDAGFYSSPFYLKVESSSGIILYAYQNNLNRRSSVFRDSLLIEKTTTLSFGLYHGDSIVRLGSKSYFIDFKTNFSTVSLTVSYKSFYDSISGIYVDGPNAYYDTTLKVMLNSNYSKKAEREVYVEMFDTRGHRIIYQDAGIRIFGGMTIYYPEKSLRLIARKKYGISRFKADIFDQGKKKYKQFILRHSGNDYRKTRFKDALSTSLASQSGLDVQSFVPSHLFVNSEYWGVYNIREKLNEYYIDNHYDCGTEGVDMLQAFKLVEEGNIDKYEDLLDFVDNNKISESQHYDYLSSLMDIRNFTNFWIYQIYFGNTDVRGNIRFWRSDSLDGKFRWIVYDTDLGWGSYSSSLLYDFTSPIKTEWYNPTWATFLLRNLLSNNKFEKDFINQTSYLISSLLSTEHVTEKIEEFEKNYKAEMVYHFNNRKKFQNYQGNINKWQEEVDQLKFFALKRDDKLLLQVQDKFNLSDPYNLDIIIQNSENGKVLLNNNTLQSDTFRGRFFLGLDIPISIVPNVGYSFKGWDKSVISNTQHQDLTINISFIHNKRSESQIIINEIDYINDCFEIFNQENKDISIEGWNIVDKNQNIYTIPKGILGKQRFAVFHFNDIDDKIDSVLYYKINFRLSSSSDLVALYDNKGNFVDSVSYILDTVQNSYTRNIPFKQLDDISMMWENNEDLTIGYHNTNYTRLLYAKLQKEAYNRRVIFIGIGVIFIILIASLLIYRRKRFIQDLS